MSKILTDIEAIVSPSQVLTAPEDLEHYGKDWTTQRQPKPLAVVLPQDVSQIVEIVKLANKHKFALVPSGGRTGLSGGAMAANGEVVLSLERLNKIKEFNAADRMVTCEAGVITANLQQFAKDKGLFYPVDFSSSGSSHIGGNIATNAGGIKVIKYGLTRERVAALKVVTAAGELLELNHGLKKNATGIDLRHLFIGSEGVLGIIVEAALWLEAPPPPAKVMLLAVPDINSLMQCFIAMRDNLDLLAFEFFSDNALDFVLNALEIISPLQTRAPYYALLEYASDDSSDEVALMQFENYCEQGHIVDGVLSQSDTQAQDLWRIREEISATIAKFYPYKNDIAVTAKNVAPFLHELEQQVKQHYPEFTVVWFGHIGDGNLHLNILKPKQLPLDKFVEKCNKATDIIFALLQKYHGSISAEHGVGLLKKPYLHYSKSPAEINFMKNIKKIFDPNNIMNPGKMV